MKRSRKAITTAVAAAALLLGMGSAQSASAATNGVYIVTPKSWGWCPNIKNQKNYVSFVSVTNHSNGYSQTDFGDDIGWTSVNLNKRNSIQVNVGCSLGHGSRGITVDITPRRHKQAWYVGPTGVTWGN